MLYSTHMRNNISKLLILPLVALFLLFLPLDILSQQTVSIASFNLRMFGPSKAENADVMALLAAIIRQYDIVAVQEIRDKEGSSIQRLLSFVDNSGDEYAMLVSPRLGRTSSKEQYAFIYKKSMFEVFETPIIWDDIGDRFEREPFLAMFKTIAGTFDFVLVNIHTKPEDATNEIALLPSVMQYAAGRYKEPDVLCLGDWNADGMYFREETYASLFPPDTYLWIIPNDADTTVAAKSNAYDRMAATATIMEDWTGQWGVYRFDEQQWFSEKGIKPTDISDHYPIWSVFYIDKDMD